VKAGPIARLQSENATTVAPTIALIGRPNTGKTTLFNRLCGVRAKTANFPGTTTAVRRGRAGTRCACAEVVDLPGIYDLRLDSPEARLARDVLAGKHGRPPEGVVVIVDACDLSRQLLLAAELRARAVPVVIALNMVDLARRRGSSVDAALLARRLDAPVVPIAARHGEGVDALERVIAGASARSAGPCPSDLLHATRSTEALVQWVDEVVAAAAGGSPPPRVDTFGERLDRAFTHPLLGVFTFVATMSGLFWVLFSLAAVPMNLIETTFATLGHVVTTSLPPGPIRDLLADGIIGGIAGTIVFLPQICLLFFLISLLEDTGYLARAAFVMDRLLNRFGLPGQAFVPLLTSHACAVPAVMGTRLIPSRRDRLATILVAPFMSCSARLPVYVLLISLLLPGHPALAAAAFTACYVLGGTAGLFSAWILGRTVLRGRALPMALELPSYKMPSLGNALLAAKDQGLTFLRTAGTTIMAICVVMWWLSAYPRVDASRPMPDRSVDASRVTVTGVGAESFAGQLGHTLQPLFSPIGFDWQLTMAVLTSFLAREVLVSTLSVLAGGAETVDADSGVVTRIQAMTREDGSPVFTPATAASTLVFFVLAMQCLPTLAVTRKETGSWRYPALQLVYMSSLAYGCALVIYQALRAAGLS
jgi:ferrous iron transport protein B